LWWFTAVEFTNSFHRCTEPSRLTQLATVNYVHQEVPEGLCNIIDCLFYEAQNFVRMFYACTVTRINWSLILVIRWTRPSRYAFQGSESHVLHLHCICWYHVVCLQLSWVMILVLMVKTYATANTYWIRFSCLNFVWVNCISLTAITWKHWVFEFHHKTPHLVVCCSCVCVVILTITHGRWLISCGFCVPS
jgi:hypothetical protein